jgi:hypothetical protein
MTKLSNSAPLTSQQIDAIIPFLDRFSVEGFSVGTWHRPPDHIPYFEYSKSVSEFQQALYHNG